MLGSGSRRNCLRAGAALAIFAPVVPAFAQVQTYNFDIPAQDLGSALKAFARASHQQITFDARAVHGKRSPALKGTYTAKGAIDYLLQGSDLRADVGGSGLFIVRLSDSATAAIPNGPARSTASSLGEEAKRSSGDIVVTGTRILGESPASPIITIDQGEIKRSGYTSTAELLVSLPQNSSGGLGPAAFGAGASSSTIISDVGAATGISLRGLGADSTLTLINGRRLPSTGFTSAIDASVIPLAAVDHVDVVADGASAIYGSDAVGGVVNFLLKRSYDGLQTSASLSGTSDGDGSDHEFNLLVGHSWQSGGFIANAEYNNQRSVVAADRPFSSGANPNTTLIPSNRSFSGLVSLHQDITNGVQAHFQGLYAHGHSYLNEGDASATFATTTNKNSYVFSGGLTARLPSSWVANVDSDIAKDFVRQSVIRSATTSSRTREVYDNDYKDIEATATGPLIAMRGSNVRLALGAGYRAERASNTNPDSPGSNSVGKRGVTYAYAEMLIPFVPVNANRSWIDRFDIDIAGRYEHYTDAGNTFNPKVGIVFKPIRDVTLKGSWGTSFHAPDLITEHSPAFVYFYPVPDPSDPSGVSNALINVGTSQNLKPETARIWTLSAELEPVTISGLDLHATYFNYNFSQRIARPLTNPFDPFSDPAGAEFIIANPTSAQINSVLASTPNFFNFSGFPFDASLVQIIVNDANQNVSRWIARGVDFGGLYAFEFQRSKFQISLNGTLLRQRQQVASSLPVVTTSGVVFGPPKFKLRGGVNWQLGDFSANAYVNYLGPETDIFQPARPRVASVTTVDAQIAYNLGKNSIARLTVFNIANVRPPRISLGDGIDKLGYDSANASPFGRIIRLQFTQDW